MVYILLTLSEKNEFISFEASGHAGYKKRGSDIVCSAVTVLLRTGISCLEGYDVSVSAEKRGSLFCTVKSFTGEQSLHLQFIGDFLKRGLESLQREFPRNIRFIIKQS